MGIHTHIPAEVKSWISDETFKLVRLKSIVLRRNNQEEVRRLGKELRRNLRQDRRKRVWNVSVLIEERLEARDVIGACDALKNWYKNVTGKTLKPSKIDLEHARKTYEDLFKKEILTDEIPFDFDYEGTEGDDSIPSEEEIKRALFRMRNRKAPGLSLITVDKLKEWCLAAH